MICVVFIRCLSRACLAKSIVFRSDDTMKSSQIPEHVLVQFLHPGRARAGQFGGPYGRYGDASTVAVQGPIALEIVVGLLKGRTQGRA